MSYMQTERDKIRPLISVSFPGDKNSRVVDDLNDQHLPRVGERLLIPKYTYTPDGKRNSYTLFEGVITQIVHIPHPNQPQILIKLRDLNFFDHLF